jgi:hypothetical protein
MTKVKILAKHFGGNWTYRGMSCWECVDGRIVQGCSRGVDQFDNPLPGGPVWYLYPADGGMAELFEWPASKAIVPDFPKMLD